MLNRHSTLTLNHFWAWSHALFCCKFLLVRRGYSGLARIKIRTGFPRKNVAKEISDPPDWWRMPSVGSPWCLHNKCLGGQIHVANWQTFYSKLESECMGCHRFENLLSARLRLHNIPHIRVRVKASTRFGKKCICPYRMVSHKRRNHTNYVKS